ATRLVVVKGMEHDCRVDWRGHWLLVELRPQHPLAKYRDGSVDQQTPAVARRRSVEVVEHLIAEVPPKPRRVHPQQADIQPSQHHALLGRGAIRTARAFFTMVSRRVISAENTRRPDAVRR